jgi:hypothetical protein
MIRSDGTTCVRYEVSGVMRESNSIPIAAKIRPGTISGFGPTFGSNCDAIPAKIMIPKVNGRNAKPDFSGLNPRITWR